MMKHHFELKTDEDLILLPAWVSNHKIQLALDTAATHTVIDSNILWLIDFNPKNLFGTQLLETSNGVITTQQYKLPEISVLGKTLYNFEIMTYDFLEKGI